MSTEGARLRMVETGNLSHLFEPQLDPESNRVAVMRGVVPSKYIMDLEATENDT